MSRLSRVIPLPVIFALTVAASSLVGCAGATVRDDSCVSSPHGSVDPGARFYSADKRFYARELEPFNSGKIAVFDRETHEGVTQIKLDEDGNPLKGGCIARDGSWAGLVYHHDDGPTRKGYVSIVDSHTAEELQRLTIPEYFHNFRLSQDGTAIIADGHRLLVGPFEDRR